MSNYQQTKVFSIFVGFNDGKQKLVGYVNVREQLSPADFKAVENKLWDMFQYKEHNTIGHFHIVPEVKRNELDGDLAELLGGKDEEEVIDPETVEPETEDDTPF
jgi:hypothetical protein